MKKINEKENEIRTVLIEEITGQGPSAKKKRNFWQVIQIPLLAIVSGLILGAILIAVTSETVYAAFKDGFFYGIGQAFYEVGTAYLALLTGSLGDPIRIFTALQSGDAASIRSAINPILESLVQTTPYIFAGLACALGFRAGLFNIGVEGQLFMGAIAATYVGYSITGLPAYIHMPLAFLAGALGGAIWGIIPGILKATTGGNEVINCIMMNYISYRLVSWLLTGPMTRPDTGGMPLSPVIQVSAEIPQFFESPIRFHLGFFIALLFAFIVWWVLFKTTWGLNLRTVGANPRAAKYAGLNIAKVTVIGMAMSGALAGMAGANEVLAVNHFMAPSLSSGYGFNSIALALLGNSHPVGVILSSLLFGILQNGATRMEVMTKIPSDIVVILQALILIFVAAPAIIRSVYRLRDPKNSAVEATTAAAEGSK
ncbi:MAG: ABC transporter permease [Anaerolineaceae bacterium]|nr:ABC transporter permease [Anaerolineaceae bacterium]